MNWNELKEKILFSYLDTDWISVDILNSTYAEILKSISTDSEFELIKNEQGISILEIENVEFCFYNNKNHHFDFDPKVIDTEKKWNRIVEFFLNLSNQLEKSIVFRPEDSNKDETENYLIKITSNGKIEYFEDVVKQCKSPEIENK